MSFQEKINVAGKYLNGSRNLTDLGMFWHRPRLCVGGELMNRAGLQPLRCIYEHLKHRPKLKELSPDLADHGRALVEDGFVVIEDFLAEDAFKQIKEEFTRATDPGSDTSKVTVSNGVSSTSGVFVEELCPATSEHLLQNKGIWAMISAALGIQLKYQPGAYFHTETLNDELTQDTDHNIVLHEDVHYPTFKAFYLLNRNTPSNGSFVMVPGSHHFDRRRLKHEYLYSIDMARQKTGKPVTFPVHANGRLEVFGPVYSNEELREVQISGEANSLVIANTMGFHRRGGASLGKERQQVRMSFRCAETLHHKLYPYWGTKGSQRLKENNYY